MKTKFRTFLKSSNYYVKVTQLIFDDNGNIKKLLFKRPLNKTANTSTNTEYDTFEYVADADDLKDFVFEQCTGLKDKNNKLIYGSDIVNVTQLYRGTPIDKVVPFKVSYKNGRFNIHDISSEYLEIIGNIHENSSLLLTRER